MPVQTVASRRRDRARLDRGNRCIGAILGKMRTRGLTLHLTHTGCGPEWTLSNGEKIPPATAARLLRHPNIRPSNDTLFPGLHLRGQSFHLVL